MHLQVNIIIHHMEVNIASREGKMDKGRTISCDFYQIKNKRGRK